MAGVAGGPRAQGGRRGGAACPSSASAPSRGALTLLCPVQGLVLDCDAATLTVWVNGERIGVMVHPGTTNELGQPVGRLEGPLRWAVELSCNSSVRIKPPPVELSA